MTKMFIDETRVMDYAIPLPTNTLRGIVKNVSRKPDKDEEYNIFWK